MREGPGVAATNARRLAALVAALVFVLLVVPGALWLATTDATYEESRERGAAPTAAVSDDAAGAAADASGRARRDRARSRERSEPGGAPEIEGVSVGHAPGAKAADGTSSAAPDATAAAAGTPAAESIEARDAAAAGADARVRRTATPGGRETETAALVVTVTAAENGEPIVGADVVVRHGDVMLRMATQHSGRAHFAVPSGAVVAVEVKAPRRVRAWKDDVTVGPGEKALSVALDRGVVVLGRVTGPKGGLREVSVRAFAWDAYRASLPFAPEPRPVETTTTRRGGRYELDCLPRGTDCVLFFEYDGLVAEPEPVDAQPDPDFVARCDVRMEPATAVSGRVVDAKDRPLAGAWVYAFGSDADLERDEEFGGEEFAMLEAIREVVVDGELLTLPRRGRTDADGRFRIRLPAESDWVRVIAMREDVGRSRPSDRVTSSADSVLLVAPGKIVRSHFQLLTSARTPALGMTVRPWFPWERWSVAELGEGAYGDANLDGGPIAIEVTGPAGAPGVYVGKRKSAESVRWIVQLQDGVVWSGSVRDDRGAALAGALVRVGPIVGVTDSRGEFKLRGVHPRSMLLEASASGHVTESVVVDEGHNRTIRVVLARQSLVRLQLELPKGATAPAWYRLSLRGKTEAYWDPAEDRLAWGDGAVEIAPTRHDQDRLAIFVPGHRLVVLAAPQRPGETTDLGVRKLEPADAVSGVVVSPHDETVAGADVTLALAAPSPWRSFVPEQATRTAADGSFRFRDFAPGEPAQLVAESSDSIPSPARLDRESPSQRIVLSYGVTFAGEWTAASSRDTFVARLLAKDGTQLGEVPVGPGGRFEIVVARRPDTVQIVHWRIGVVRQRDVPQLPEGEVFRFP